MNDTSIVTGCNTDEDGNNTASTAIDSIRLQVVLRSRTTTTTTTTTANESVLRRVDTTGSTTTSNNHFVRLTPNTAQRLQNLAVSSLLIRSNNTTSPRSQQYTSSNHRSRRRWWIQQQQQQHDHAAPSLLSHPVSTTSGCRTASGIEFLPLAITFLTGNGHSQTSSPTIYASYNGGNIIQSDSSSSGGCRDGCHDNNNNNNNNSNNVLDLDSCIDIPDCLLTRSMTDDDNNNNNSCACVALVQPLTYIDSISQLFVEPVTTTDWELLELDAVSLAEGGRFLQQISVVYSGQIIHLTLSNGSTANLVVLPRNFDRIDGNNSVWPKDSSATITAAQLQHHHHRCYRLLAETEIIITPKPRPVQYPLQLFPTKQDYIMTDPGMMELSNLLNIVSPISVPQGSLLIHPCTLARIRGTEVERCSDQLLLGIVQVVATTTTPLQQNSNGANTNDETISATVRIISSMNVPEEYVALHPLIRIQINASLFGERLLVSIQKFLAPIDVIKLSTIVPDLVHVGEASVRLTSVWLRTTQNRHAWRSPSYGVSDSNDIQNQQIHEFNESNYETMYNFPINFGSIVSVPSRGNTLYRLDVQIKDSSKSIKNEFLFSKELLKLCRVMESNEEVYFGESKTGICVDGTTSTRSLSRLLPPHSLCLSSSILGQVQTALLRSSVLVHGDTGCGKTFTSLLIAAVARIKRGDRCIYMSCMHLRDSATIRMKSMLMELEEVFDHASKLAPCVVILDDLDAIAPSVLASASTDDSSLSHDVNPTEVDQSKLVSDVLKHLMRSKSHGIFVVATCTSTQSLSHLLLTEGSFHHQLVVPILSESDRGTLYHSLLHQFTASNQSRWLKDISFNRKTTSFRPRDLQKLAFRTWNYLELQSSKGTLNEATSKVLEGYVPLSRLSSNTVEVSERTVKLSDLGGLRQPKVELISTIVRPSLYRRIYSQAKVRLPRGVLLFGFPGTGKSMCIPALARECGYPLITCRGPELLDKYIGASEAKIRALFARAAAAAPAILFLDELDALAPRRGSDHSGVTDRIVNQLLTFLDGVEDVAGSANGTVYVIGATSRPDKVDPALLRPGRLEKHIYFGLSDDLIEIKDLLLRISENYSLDARTNSSILSGELVQEVSSSHEMFRFFCAADFTAMFNTAQLVAVRKALDLGDTDEVPVICYDNLYEAMVSARPSLSEDDYIRLSDLYNSYRHGKTSPSTDSLEPNYRIPKILTALK